MQPRNRRNRGMRDGWRMLAYAGVCWLSIAMAITIGRNLSTMPLRQLDYRRGRCQEEVIECIRFVRVGRSG